ncbi:MAG TPA: 50S ribosomal protein L1 [Myxococcota bacterium]|nr:50S ribosomal protein L1 [Myxococcota bacterium]
MGKASKRWREAKDKVDSTRKYSLDEAVDLLKDTANAGFDESVDLAVRLGVNPRHSDQMIRGATSLPHGTGKTVRILVFAQGEAAKHAEEAGADFVGSDELIQKIQKENWLDFDKAVATRDLMGKVGRIGRILGPRGLMPNPKVGTVVAPEHIARTVKELKGGRIDFRVEKSGIVHAPVGKASMTAEALRDNIVALVNELIRLRPASAKGTYVRGVAVSSTMGVGVRLDTTDLLRAAGR